MTGSGTKQVKHQAAGSILACQEVQFSKYANKAFHDDKNTAYHKYLRSWLNIIIASETFANVRS